MQYLTAITLLGLLLGGQSLGQTRPQGHTPTKDQQAAQAAEIARAKALRAAKTAALVVRATTTVACPGGAPGDCIRTDADIISQVQRLVDGTEIWEYFEKVNATEADIFLEIAVRNSSTVSFNVRDADSNKILYSEYREVVSLDNDVNRMIAHFLVGAPKRTEAEQESFRKKRRCVSSVATFEMSRAYYRERLKDYTWKLDHFVDGVMNECEEHWKDFVCLKRGQGDYASNWNESINEFQRKLKLESEEVQGLEQQMKAVQAAAEAESCALPPSE